MFVQKIIHFIKIQNVHSKQIFIFLKVQNIHSKQIFIFLKSRIFIQKIIHFFKRGRIGQGYMHSTIHTYLENMSGQSKGTQAARPKVKSTWSWQVAMQPGNSPVMMVNAWQWNRGATNIQIVEIAPMREIARSLFWARVTTKKLLQFLLAPKVMGWWRYLCLLKFWSWSI